jgi:Fic family protein
MEIVKRGVYFYLGHSFRKAGKTVYREKYLGKVVPENIEDIKIGFFRKCLAEEVFVKLDKIRDKFSKEWGGFPESIKKKMLVDLSINLTYNTNAIEGSKITKQETDDLIRRRISPNRPIDDVQETIAHSRLFFRVIQEEKNLTKSLLLEWHSQLFGETKHDIAGSYRDYLVRVGEYLAPDWQDVENLMGDYLHWYNDNKKIIHPMELAGRMHYRFEKIHPFGDGNGRIGRLIITYLLAKAHYPLMVIDYKSRKSYYHALSGDENRFLQYFFRRYIREYTRYI